MVDSTTHAPVLHRPAAPDGPHVGGPWLGHCPPSALTVRHPRIRRNPGTSAAESTTYVGGRTLSSPYWPRLSWLAIVQTIRYLPGLRVTLVRTTSPGWAVGVRAYCFSSSSPSGRSNWTIATLCVSRPTSRATISTRPAGTVIRDGRIRYSSRRRRSVRPFAGTYGVSSPHAARAAGASANTASRGAILRAIELI